MFCAKCGGRAEEGVSFCRRCGTELERASPAPVKRSLPAEVKPKDPDELTANGIGSVVVGDGFFMVAVILSASQSSVGSPLWLFLLIPAFYFFGRGLADVLHARQIRRRQKGQGELNAAPKIAELPPQGVTAGDIFRKTISGELSPAPSVAEGTTRDLE